MFAQVMDFLRLALVVILVLGAFYYTIRITEAIEFIAEEICEISGTLGAMRDEIAFLKETEQDHLREHRKERES